MLGIADNVRVFGENMKKWKLLLNSNGSDLCEVVVNKCIIIDDLKLFGKSDDQIDSLVQTVFTFSEDIGTEFELKKCGMVVLKVIINLLSLMEI